MAVDEKGSESEVFVRLLKSSSQFAQSATAAYTTESWDVFYLHLATATELLIKARLAWAHPSLIAEARANFDSLLHLCGLGDRARNRDFARAVRTISVNDALPRVARLVEDYQPPPPNLRFLLDIRNAIVHIGHRERGEAETVLGESAQYAAQLLRDLDMSDDEYWGGAAEMVAEHSSRRLTVLEATYSRRLQAARDRYEARVKSFSPDALKAFVAAAVPSAPRASFDSAPVACPACGHSGELTGFPEPEWEPDFDCADGQSYLAGAYVSSIRLQADGFKCYICNLELDPWELPLAKLEHRTLTKEKFDISQATNFFREELGDEDWGIR